VLSCWISEFQSTSTLSETDTNLITLELTRAKWPQKRAQLVRQIQRSQMQGKRSISMRSVMGSILIGDLLRCRLVLLYDTRCSQMRLQNVSILKRVLNPSRLQRRYLHHCAARPKRCMYKRLLLLRPTVYTFMLLPLLPGATRNTCASSYCMACTRTYSLRGPACAPLVPMLLRPVRGSGRHLVLCRPCMTSMRACSTCQRGEEMQESCMQSVPAWLYL
jgi:hypothetical protein